MGRFSIRTMLVAMAIASYCLFTILNPTALCSNIFELILGAITLLAIPVAIGAQGKLRLQLLSFILTVGIFVIFTAAFQSSSVIISKNEMLYDLARLIGTGEQKLGPSGEEVRYSKRGTETVYWVRTNRSSSISWVETPKAEVKDRGLLHVAYNKSNPVSVHNLFNTLNALLTLLLGLIGYLITGYVYDQRQLQTENDGVPPR